MKMDNSVPVIQGLFTWPSDEPRLIGSKCTSCGTHFFPKSLGCNNPNCAKQGVEEVRLSTRGKIYSFTIQHYPPPPPAIIPEPFSPYGIGLVELPEGIRILGRITECDLSKIKIGMAVETVFEVVGKDQQGQPVVTWKFKPVSK